MEVIAFSVNATKIHEFKAKDSEIKKYPLCLELFTWKKKTGLNEYV